MHYRRVVLLATILAFVGITAGAQQSLPAPVLASYSLTGTGFGSANRITKPGKIYTIRIDGMLARAIANHVTPTNTIQSGSLIPPAKGFKGAFGAGGDSKQVQPDDRFYLHAITIKDNAVVFTLLSLDKVVVVSGDNGSTRSRVRMYVRFPMNSEQLTSLTPEALHKLTDPIFAPEGVRPTVQLGQSLADVIRTLGEPQQQVDLGQKKILVYARLKVTLVDGKVTDAE
jgi:hypothetical protein